MSWPANPANGETYTTSSGTMYQWIDSSQQWAIVGLTGMMGETGPQGTTGAQGASGTGGLQGTTGTMGTTGLIGATGSQGNTGSQGATGLEGPTGVQGLGGYGQPYYPDDTLSGVSGSFGPLEVWKRSPSILPEAVDYATGVSNVNGYTGLKIDGYITNTGDPGRTTIPAGTWSFNIYASTSSVAAGRISTVRAGVVKYALNGTETLLFDAGNTAALTTSPALYTITYSQSADITLLTTDRLIVRFWGVQNATAGTVAITYYYAGTSRATYITTPIGKGDQGATGSQGSTGVQGPTGIAGAAGATGSQGTTGAQFGATGVLTLVLDGGGSVVPTGMYCDFVWPFGLQIDRWDFLARETGTIYCSLKTDSYANWPTGTTGMDQGGTGPYITAGIKTNATGLGGWYCSTGAYGGACRLTVNSVTTITEATLALYYHRT